MTTTFRAAMYKLLPSWLTEGDGGLAVRGLATMMDQFVARARLALVVRFPEYSYLSPWLDDEAALAAIGRDRRVVRGIDEPAEAYAARLVRAIDDHRTRGNPWTLLEQLRAYLQADCVVRTVDQSGNWFSIEADGTRTSNVAAKNWDWDGGDAAHWARFWVIIYPVNGVDPWAPNGLIGDADLWSDGGVGHPDRTIGTTATPSQVASVRSIIREWKPAHARCEWVIVAFDSATFSPSGSTDPAGEWGSWGNHTGAPVRLSTARYWRGPT